jgi:hypothetical protein
MYVVTEMSSVQWLVTRGYYERVGVTRGVLVTDQHYGLCCHYSAFVQVMQ